jgi:hypothetical protein
MASDGEIKRLKGKIVRTRKYDPDRIA